MTLSYSLVASDLNDNGYNINETEFIGVSPFSRLVFTTNGRYLFLKVSSKIFTSYPTYSHIGMRVNGVYKNTFQVDAIGGNGYIDTFQYDLGDSNDKTIELIAGLQTMVISESIPRGTFIRSVYVAGGDYLTITAPAASSLIVAYGDSIAVGQAATYPTQQSAWMLLRYAQSRSVMVEGWGRRALFDDCPDAAGRTTFAARLAGYSPATIWLAIGTNDYGLEPWSAANFGAAYADLLDKIHAAAPAAQIIAQTPLHRTSEVANSFGDTLGAYRTQIATAQAARAAWCELVDGSVILNDSDLDDGVHPTTAGHAKYEAAIEAAL